MKLGNQTIKGAAALAPMAGVADRAVRRLSREQGAAFAVGEMTSAKGIAQGNRKSLELLEPDELRPFGVQLFGCEPESMRAAAEAAARYAPDFIDLNMGCPAPKVTGGGAGSALLKNLPLAQEIARAAVLGAGFIPVTAKIRRGYDAGEDVAVEAAQRLEQAGIALITVHARTRAQMYAPPIDLGCIARVKRAVSIPVVGNGDIVTAADALRMRDETGCDLVMVGRGALGNPWIFSQINAAFEGKTPPAPPALSERLEMLRREVALLLADKGGDIGIREARKHVGWYMTGLHGAGRLRRMCGAICSLDDIEVICRLARELNPAE